jgi:phage-related protein
MNADTPQIKPIVWVGSSHKDLNAFPRTVQKDAGYALWLAQLGEKHDKTKPLKGFSGVMEIVSDYQTDTYRTIYAVKLEIKLYVLHAFQKKSKRGIAAPKKEIDVIRKRL